MERETLLLRGLFGLCVLVCVLALGSMLTATAVHDQRAATAHVLATTQPACVATDQRAACLSSAATAHLSG